MDNLQSLTNMYKTLDDLTIEQVTAAAEINSEEYDTMFKKAARAAFIEGVVWAQKIQKDGKIL